MTGKNLLKKYKKKIYLGISITLLVILYIVLSSAFFTKGPFFVSDEAAEYSSAKKLIEQNDFNFYNSMDNQYNLSVFRPSFVSYVKEGLAVPRPNFIRSFFYATLINIAGDRVFYLINLLL